MMKSGYVQVIPVRQMFIPGLIAHTEAHTEDSGMLLAMSSC